MKKKGYTYVLILLGVLCLIGCGKNGPNSELQMDGVQRAVIKSIDTENQQVVLQNMGGFKPDGERQENREDGKQPDFKDENRPDLTDGKKTDFEDDKMSNRQMEEQTYSITDDTKLLDENGNCIALGDFEEGTFVEYDTVDSQMKSMTKTSRSATKNAPKDKENRAER